MRIRSVSFVLAVPMILLFALAAPIWAYEDEEGTPMIVDALILRPLGIAATLIGVGAFLVSLPFSAATGSAGDAAEELVMEPYRFTFERPLGAPTSSGPEGRGE